MSSQRSLSSSSDPLKHASSESNIAEIQDDASISVAENNSAVRSKRRLRDTEDMIMSNKDFMAVFTKWQSAQDTKYSKLLQSLNELKSQNSDIKKSVEFMSHKYDEMLGRLSFLETERQDYKKSINRLENKIEVLERNARITSVEIRNIPLKQKETKEALSQIALNIGGTLNVPMQTSDIKNIFRVNTKSTTKPIIADFTTVAMKDKFISCFKKYNQQNTKEKLNTANIKIEGPSKRIYISENLTEKTRKLFYQAREFARNNAFTFCWTSFGKVYLRKSEGLPQIIINSEQDFEKIPPHK
ncbi:uncharacterized protein LOC123869947 [Maniola jurtina]|uniref:uncharacterized protein LOC123869947 n=1 Tax=Maniola jurtina TaxID=191418 RepID=UPI001E689A59|nr:uncharacterized protein LOC123869947 [Maniola jurtina]